MSERRIAREDLEVGGLCGQPMMKLHANDCVLADVDVTAVWLRPVSEVWAEICSPCDVGVNDCPAFNGWGNDTHRRLLIACERYREACNA